MRSLVLVTVAACSTPASKPSAVAPAVPESTNACPGPDRYIPVAWSGAIPRKDQPPAPAGWRAVLAFHPDEVATARGYEQLDDAQARAAGITAIPKAVWVFMDGKPPCRATPTRAFRSEYQYGVELAGCEQLSSGKATVSVGFTGDEDYSACAWGVAHYPRHTSVPDEIASLIASRACDAPGCEHTVAIGRAGSPATAYAYDVAQAWAPAAPETHCSHPEGDTIEMFARGPAGWSKLALPEQPFRPSLAGVLYDGAGARLLLLERYGATDIYAVDATRPQLTLAAHHDYPTAGTPKSFRDVIVDDCRAAR